MFLIKKYKPFEVEKVFNKLKEKFGMKNFKIMFEGIFTNNGWEFSKPELLETDSITEEKLINVFYTEPYSSWQRWYRKKSRIYKIYNSKRIIFDNSLN